jgi:penicillin-binding protein 1A
VASGTGTAADLSDIGIDTAGKTGTTAGYKDRYFAGFTGYYTAAVWCGFDTPAEIKLSGSTANPAARLWKKVMQPLHKGRSTKTLYDVSKMVSVSICLDSGKLATDSCYHDIRTADGLNRVEKVLVYPEDRPKGYCDKHTSVEYCVEGHGVANNYCKKFAEIGALKLETKALLKLTQNQINALKKAKGKGLAADFLRNDYIYLVDKNGAAASFFGFGGDINKGLKLPYQVCTAHTQQSWEDYTTPPTTVPPTQPPTTQPPTTQPPTVPPATQQPTTGDTEPTTLPTEPTPEETTLPTEPTNTTRPTEPEETIDTAR